MYRSEITPIVRWPHAGRYGRRLGPLWGPVHRRGMPIAAAMLIAILPALGCTQARGAAQEGALPPAIIGGELQLVERFDGHGDGWLDTGERAAARVWFAAALRGQGGREVAAGSAAGSQEEGNRLRVSAA